MFLSWFIALTLTLQTCAAETSCVFRSSAGSEVLRGSSFDVYCTFNCKCKGSMYIDNTDTPLSTKQLNSTTIYFKVEKITEKRTYNCRCNMYELKSRCHSLDPCGLDISPGYLPDRPKNISCVYEMVKSESGFVTCIWDRGRDTYFKDRFLLKVKTVSENHREGPVEKDLYTNETETPSATFSLSRSVQTILVWVQAKNDLGSVESLVVNCSVSDILMPSTPVLSQAECLSRSCIVKVSQSAGIQNLQIQFRADQQQQWTTYPDSCDSVKASERMYMIRDLSPGLYSLWMSASTAKGEGPAGQKIKFYIQEDPQLYPLIMCVCAVLAVPFLCYLWKNSAVKQRFRQIFSCLIPDVPDPANSKWAKECTKDKGKMIFQLPPGNSSLTNNEDETILVNVEEIFKQRCDTYTPSKVSPRPPIQTSLSPETEPTTMLYPAQTTYIKSFSHDSDSSNHTENSLDTNTTVGYISLHGSGNLDTSHQEEEEEHFFPSLSLFTEPLELRGKLTLDAVKIDCSDFFQNAYCDSES
ncbi:interleukin-12 receptor subunit beta-2 [Nematolebias whitei]|uniref:interleukin-12 receptor subunit beta-2 n=1 Tax=Nematolebias whitei TaxID=451745 RepID=UPI0018999A01|nr:interleukin-12 receptor subunit beta-2 [Nematolebias whitei]